ncbi:hypothetical protein IVA79_05940 [Bradyrhizobium sp. 138]|uniref:hypothetical protein n=1 Tax=Bradyrhizobium sp. 138 TaxID=2782615 RepID=UPI001FF89755|nr:hypothetical protein [Bradyrhizobium sp. 138]MCK1733511.1 hypothetical protein [Bradyrhizobium sp. 138]
MDNVVRFVSKSERERERLIREARAIYDSIFPPTTAAGLADDGLAGETQAPPSGHTPSRKSAVDKD